MLSWLIKILVGFGIVLFIYPTAVLVWQAANRAVELGRRLDEWLITTACAAKVKIQDKFGDRKEDSVEFDQDSMD